jgi:hypothetical protein
MFKKLIAVAVLAFATFAAQAEGISYDSVKSAGWNALSESQKAAVLQQVADQAKKVQVPAIPDVPTVKKVDQYVDIGIKIGQMLGSAAKELGIAVNDFAKTPVGQMAMVLIAWHYAGAAAIHIAGGFIVLFVGIAGFIMMYKRMTTTNIKYSPEKTDIFGRARKVSVVREEFSSDAVMYLSCYIIGLVIVTAFTTFSF